MNIKNQQLSDFRILDNIPAGILLLDINNKIIFTNLQFLETYKCSMNEIVNYDFFSIKFLEINNSQEKPIDIGKCIKKSEISGFSKSVYLLDSKGNKVLVFVNINNSDKNIYNIHKIVTITDISKEVTCVQDTDNKTALLITNPLNKIVGKDPKMLNLYKMIELASESLSNVIITGESGTGKELIANAIHQLSDRKSKPFIKVNCAAIPESLLESELFGHVKGSFTGAYKDKPGKFELANNGTLFLDEIGEISPLIQVKLLRAIQEKTIERIGDTKEIKINIRIIAATNRNLREMIKNNTFREDLYYRLNVFPINTIPLKDRINDIPVLCEHFIDKFNKITGKKIKGLNENAMRIILDYCWPGNVRELENSIEHAFVLCKNDYIDVFDLPMDIRIVSLKEGWCKNSDKKINSLDKIDNILNKDTDIKFKNKMSKDELIEILEANHYNKTITASKLGISRVALWKKLKKYGIE